MANENDEPRTDDFDNFDTFAEAEDQAGDETMDALENHAATSRAHAKFGVTIMLAALGLLIIYTQQPIKDSSETSRKAFEPNVKAFVFTIAFVAIDKDTRLPVKGLSSQGRASEKDGPFDAEGLGVSAAKENGWLVLSGHGIGRVYVKLGAPGYHSQVVMLNADSSKTLQIELVRDRATKWLMPLPEYSK